MPPALVRSLRLAAALLLALSGSTLAGCSLDGDTTLPPLTDPATQIYATNTNVVIANMTRVGAQLYREDVVVGTGAVLAKGDSISVYYVGRLTGGFQFDARARPEAPFPMSLDSTRLIRGWVDGLEGMRVGGTRRLVIGPELGYQYRTVREQPSQRVIIPANSVLVFEVELAERFTRP